VKPTRAGRLRLAAELAKRQAELEREAAATPAAKEAYRTAVLLWLTEQRLELLELRIRPRGVLVSRRSSTHRER